MKYFTFIALFFYMLQEIPDEAKRTSVSEIRMSATYYLNHFELLELEGQFIQRVRPDVFMFKDPTGEISVRFNSASSSDLIKLGSTYTIHGTIKHDERGVAFEVINFTEGKY